MSPVDTPAQIRRLRTFAGPPKDPPSGRLAAFGGFGRVVRCAIRRRQLRVSAEIFLAGQLPYLKLRNDGIGVTQVSRHRPLDLRAAEPVAICLGTAAAAYGFDIENNAELHVLSPIAHQLRNSDGLIVHRRAGAPLGMVDGRPATEPAWTAVEVVRSLCRPRALATLDSARRSRTCDRRQLLATAARQAGRRGIANVRELIPLAAAEAESPMESQARLVMLDGGLPRPVLQFEIVDRNWRTWRVDFAWPECLVAVEYDGFDYHSSPDALRQDRQKRAALQEVGWTVLSIVADDVRRRPWDMVRRIEMELTRSRAACRPIVRRERAQSRKLAQRGEAAKRLEPAPAAEEPAAPAGPAERRGAPTPRACGTAPEAPEAPETTA